MANESNLNVQQASVESSNSQYRAIFNAIRKTRENCTITWSYIRSEILLTATSGTLKFPILVNDSPAANVNERRLNISDEFQVVKFGLFIYKNPSSQVIDEQILQTYPNAALFSKSGEARALMSLYNGFFSITLDRKQVIPYLDAMQSFVVPDAQAGITTAAIAGPVVYTIANNAMLNNDYGMIEALPTFRLSGAIVNEVILNANAKDMTGTSSSNYAVFFARGFLIQNGAQFTTKNQGGQK